MGAVLFVRFALSLFGLGLRTRRRRRKVKERERKKNHFSLETRERKGLALVVELLFWRATRKKKGTGIPCHASSMADWLSDDALLAALASEPAPLHHLTGKGRD